MKRYTKILFLICCVFIACKTETKKQTADFFNVKNSVEYASGFELYVHDNFTLLKVTKPWPNATYTETFVLHKKDVVLPDSLKNTTQIIVPLQTVVVTSTTHIPSLEMLGVEKTMVGFPNTDYISSEKIRKNVNAGLIKEVGKNELLNTEILLDLQPDVLVGFGINGQNPTLDLLKKNGQKVIFNGDWVEQSPLGKAEWIKLFGALYDKNEKATEIFNSIKNEYKKTLSLVDKSAKKPSILCGAIYQDVWYMPEGDSWAALFLKEAHGNYLWQNNTGIGSLALSFETVLEKAQNADFWIGPSQFCSLKEMQNSNPHYSQFKAFQTKNVYSFAVKKGEKGGLLYYELAPNRPDLVLKDLIKILHPECLPNHQLYFFQKLE